MYKHSIVFSVSLFCSVFHTSPASVRASPGAVSPSMSCGTCEHQNFLTINAETERVSWASSSGDYKSSDFPKTSIQHQRDHHSIQSNSARSACAKGGQPNLQQLHSK